jgi:5-methylcytosine-specific restriction protein A
MPRASRTHLNKRKYIDKRPNSNQRGYNYRWRKQSRLFLRKNPLCVECLKYNITTLATHVDHIKPHRGDMNIFWDKDNWQSLCTTHHNQKSAREKKGNYVKA